MPIEFQKHITREDVRANPLKLYIFGDNFQRVGFGGQAYAMRGEPNTLGIVTKVSPNMNKASFLNDTQHYYDCLLDWAAMFAKLHRELERDTTIVIPVDGIGTGLAELETRAPRCWRLLQFLFDQLYEAAEDKVPASGDKP